jgi:integrase
VFRKNVEAPSKREAEKLLDLFAAEVLRGQYVEPSKLTLKQFVERWLRDYVEAELAPKTVHRYKEILARVLQAMGHLKMEQIKPMHLVEFYNNLREEGIRKDGKTGKLSDSTVLYHHRVINSLFNDAVKWEVIPSNPASKVDPPKVKTKQAPCYDEEQTAALLAALDKEPLKYKVMVILALATGLRRGEIMGLEWPDVDFEANTLTVRRASQYLPEKGTFSKDPKNETSNRVIAVPESVMALLKQYKAHQNEERLKVGDLWQGSNRLFTSWDGRPMHPDTISSWFPKFLARHNLPRIKFHALRHTSATLLIAEGIPLKNVSTRLGHADTRTTDKIYAHALVSVDRKAAQVMDNILTGKKKHGQV